MSSDDRERREGVPSESAASQEPSGSSAEEASSGATRPYSTTDEGNTAPPPQASAPAYYDDPYDDLSDAEKITKSQPPPPPPPPPMEPEESDDDEEGMLRMSFVEHLEELRKRLLHSLGGLLIAYLGCLVMARDLFGWMRAPFDRAIKDLAEGGTIKLIAITPIEQFQLLYIKLPLVAAVFVAAPWLMYQAWAFIAPGLYRRERRWAGPFILSTAGLFILGGLFGYFVALRFAFTFLLGIGEEVDIQPMISIESYADTFISILLGLGVVFQMPIVIFFLTLLRILKPGFLLNNVRYAVLIIFVVAAIITPTPDVFNMIIFATPMILLFFVGIAASYLLVWHREGGVPWKRLILAALLVTLAILGAAAGYLHYAGYQISPHFPWILRP